MLLILNMPIAEAHHRAGDPVRVVLKLQLRDTNKHATLNHIIPRSTPCLFGAIIVSATEQTRVRLIIRGIINGDHLTRY